MRVLWLWWNEHEVVVVVVLFFNADHLCFVGFREEGVGYFLDAFVVGKSEFRGLFLAKIGVFSPKTDFVGLKIKGSKHSFVRE